jgi:uncharacterized Fe-S cluster-containing MiaB family protein
MLFHLFYVSNLSSDIPIESANQVIDAILSKANAYNPTRGLTGVLLFRAGIFLQLLEGPEAEVRTLFERIKKDPRNQNITEILAQPTQSRIFDQWSMGFREVSELDFKMVNEILSWNKLILAAKEVDRNLILHMLERFKTKVTAARTG